MRSACRSGCCGARPARGGRAALVRSDCGEHENHGDASAPGGVRTLAGEPMAVREWTGGSRRWPKQHEVSAGEVLLYVARGGLEVDLDGEIHALQEGDALLFDGGVPHRLRRTGGVATRALKVAERPPSARSGQAPSVRSRCTPPCGSSWSALESISKVSAAASRNGPAGGRPGSASHSSDAGPSRRGSSGSSSSALRRS